MAKFIEKTLSCFRFYSPFFEIGIRISGVRLAMTEKLRDNYYYYSHSGLD